MKPTETTAQNNLKAHKPLVYDKVIQHGMRIIRLEWSYMCNMRCEHCSIRELQGKSTRRAMTIEDAKNLADQAHELGFGQFVITGGEPTLFGDFGELVSAIGPQRFWITADTNGWLMDETRARHWKQIGVDKVQLSVDSLDADTHDEFRHKAGAWEHAVDSIWAIKDAGLRLIVQTVVDKKRAMSDELIEFIQFFNEMRVPVYISYAKPAGAWAGRDDVMIGMDEFAYIEGLAQRFSVFTHLTPSYNWPGGCIAAKRMLNVTRYGDVNPCPFMQELSIGNLFNEPLMDIEARAMKRFDGHIPVCLMAMDKEFIDGLHKQP